MHEVPLAPVRGRARQQQVQQALPLLLRPVRPSPRRRRRARRRSTVARLAGLEVRRAQARPARIRKVGVRAAPRMAPRERLALLSSVPPMQGRPARSTTGPEASTWTALQSLVAPRMEQPSGQARRARPELGALHPSRVIQVWPRAQIEPTTPTMGRPAGSMTGAAARQGEVPLGRECRVVPEGPTMAQAPRRVWPALPMRAAPVMRVSQRVVANPRWAPQAWAKMAVVSPRSAPAPVGREKEPERRADPKRARPPAQIRPVS
jgi:hypothetical protein